MSPSPIALHSFTPPVKPRVMILGGTGRVGASTAAALSRFCPSLRLVLAGRNREKGEALASKIGENTEFVQVNVEDIYSIQTALDGIDLVIHSAGPFQQEEKCNVLEAAISSKTAYLDVCDDTNYAWKAKGFHEKALSADVPALTTCGIYPGVSNVMAAELVRLAKSEINGEPERLRFFYYTAGSGGAGPTIIATSFLLLGEDVIAYNKGNEVKLKPYGGMLSIDFGKGVGRKDVFLLNLPEVKSAHEILGVPTVSARFGTAPFFWNWGMEAIANFVPANILRDKSKVQQLVRLFDPYVRAIDVIVGERVSMRVDLECTNGRTTLGLFTHKQLSVSVGNSTAAFAMALLEGGTQPGVWFPEQPEGVAVESRGKLLERAAQGTINFVLNQIP